MKEQGSINRMKELLGLMNQKGEAFIESTAKEVDENKINEEFQRLKNLATTDVNSLFKEYHQTPVDKNNSYVTFGKTVNSIVDDYANAQNNGLYKGAPNISSLKEEEALEISIKRTLKSGQPVNDIGFYEEVNWHLMSLGFTAKNPVDIKDVIIKIIDNKC